MLLLLVQMQQETLTLFESTSSSMIGTDFVGGILLERLELRLCVSANRAPCRTDDMQLTDVCCDPRPFEANIS